MEFKAQDLDRIKDLGRSNWDREICGVITPRGVIHCPNDSSDPENHFSLDLSQFSPNQIQTIWHTHCKPYHLEVLSEDDWNYSRRVGFPLLMYHVVYERWDFSGGEIKNCQSHSDFGDLPNETQRARITRQNLDFIVGFKAERGYSDNDPEIGGWIYSGGEIAEVPNQSDRPIKEMLCTQEPSALAFWHWHPGGSQYAHLSEGDRTWADQTGQLIIMYHPQSDVFDWYAPASESIDCSELEKYGGTVSTDYTDTGSPDTEFLKQENDALALELLKRLQLEREKLRLETAVAAEGILSLLSELEAAKALREINSKFLDINRESALLDLTEAQSRLREKAQLLQLKSKCR